MCKVSVLTPVYNIEKYLSQCLDSLRSQTLEDMEFICINDGSIDRSLSILREYAKRDSRIKIIDQKNGGYGKAMNAGLMAACGEYIGIVESDDFADAHMFESLYDIAVMNQADLVKSDYINEMELGSKRADNLHGLEFCKQLMPRQNAQDIFFRSPSIWSAIYKRDFLDRYHIRFHETPGASYQDVSFFVMTMACAERAVFVPEEYLHYRMDNANSSVHSKGKVNCIFEEFAEAQRFLSQYPQIQQKMQIVLSGMKGLHYIVNYRRIGQEYKKIFLDRMADEFEQDAAAGFLDRTLWSDEHWKLVQRMLADRDQFYLEDFERQQRALLLLRGFLDELQDMSEVYLYGAGKVGQQVLSFLAAHGVQVNGFLVTSRGNNPEVLDGIPVKVSSEAGLDATQSLILISVAERMQAEILIDLQEKGFGHCMTMSAELRRILAEN